MDLTVGEARQILERREDMLAEAIAATGRSSHPEPCSEPDGPIPQSPGEKEPEPEHEPRDADEEVDLEQLLEEQMQIDDALDELD